MPSAYSLGVAVGWRRFAISGDYARVASSLLPDSGREAADVGLSYLGRKWRTTLLLGGERSTSQTKMFDVDRSYSVDLGGAYELTRNLAVSGGLRHQVRKDRLFNLTDDRRDSQAGLYRHCAQVLIQLVDSGPSWHRASASAARDADPFHPMRSPEPTTCARAG